MRKARIAGTAAERSAVKPRCPECNSTDNVVRLHGEWVCRVHLKVKNTRFEQNSRVLLPAGVADKRLETRPFIPLTEIVPNRAARRALARSR